MQLNAVFEIKRNLTQNKHQYLIYDRPLAEGTKLKISILSVNPSDRHLELGVIDSARYDDIRRNNFATWSRGFALNFCGYDCFNLTGKFPATSKSDQNGFKPGDVLFLESRPGAVAIYNTGKTVDLVSAKLGGKQPRYFFLRFYYKETAATVEQLA